MIIFSFCTFKRLRQKLKIANIAPIKVKPFDLVNFNIKKVSCWFLFLVSTGLFLFGCSCVCTRELCVCVRGQRHCWSLLIEAGRGKFTSGVAGSYTISLPSDRRSDIQILPNSSQYSPVLLPVTTLRVAVVLAFHSCHVFSVSTSSIQPIRPGDITNSSI